MNTPLTIGNSQVVLQSLPVNGLASAIGYSAAQFGPIWSDNTTAPLGHNGCPTDQDILRRDLKNVVLAQSGHKCDVVSGVLDDPYTGTRINYTGSKNATGVQIDYIVPLLLAWQTGAQQLTLQQRLALANDPLNLLATDEQSIRAQTASAINWLPPDSTFICQYESRQIAVIAKYHLWVTPSEQGLMSRSMTLCYDPELPVEPGTITTKSSQ